MDKSHVYLLAAALVTVFSLSAAVYYVNLAGSLDLVPSHETLEADEHGGPAIRNYFVNVWFCLLLAFLAFQNLALQTQVSPIYSTSW